MGTRNTVAWASLGNAVAAYDIALTYAQRRTQFGRPIAKIQMVQSMLVDMLGDVTAMQLYCIRLGRLIDDGKLTETMAALAKYYCSVKARDVCRLARDVLGGNGITLDFHVMRHMCDMEASSPTKERLRSRPASSDGTSPARAPSCNGCQRSTGRHGHHRPSEDFSGNKRHKPMDKAPETYVLEN